MTEIDAIEIGWYKRNGKYPKSRIVKDNNGDPYMIGDWAWNRDNTNKEEEVKHLIKIPNKLK